MARVKVLSDPVFTMHDNSESAEPWKLDPAEQSPPDGLLIADAAQIRGLHPQCFKHKLFIYFLCHAV